MSRGCIYCGTALGAWREVREAYYDGLTMRRRCGCGLTYDMFRVVPAAIRYARDCDGLVGWEIDAANKRALLKGWSPSWGFAREARP